MTTFGRYVFRQAAGALLLILLSLTGVVWIALALKQLNLVTSEGQSAWMLFRMTTLAVPNLMVLIAPIALLIAVMHVLNRLNGDSELIVLTAAGATSWTVGRPLLVLGALVSMAVSVTNHFIMPWSLREVRELVIQIRADLIGQVIQGGAFSSPEKDLTFHIRERAFNGELLGLLMHDARDPKQVITYIAERGVIVKREGSAFLVMHQGHILRRTTPAEPSQIVVFDTYAVDLDRFEQKGEQAELKPRERYYRELTEGLPDRDELFHREYGSFRAELHERFSSPLYPIAFILIAVAFAGRARSTRQNRIESIVLGFMFATLGRLGGLACNNLVVVNAAWVPALYVVPATMGGLALIGIAVGARPRSRPTVRDRIGWMIEAAGRALPRRRRPQPGGPAGAGSGGRTPVSVG